MIADMQARISELEGSELGAVVAERDFLKGELDKLQAKFQEALQELDARRAESAEKEAEKNEDEKPVDANEDPGV